ncbi:MAG: NAD(P)H-dependent oxidoreductase subunit E [Saprospiraceae bacterium]|nr:NAD(P)H-dependent oxidoreductase subunit E [Saprospiraceae bacterium]
MDNKIKTIVDRYDRHSDRLMDILHEVQDLKGHISGEDIDDISKFLGIAGGDVRMTISFYHFFRTDKSAKYNIYLNNSIVSKMYGCDKIAGAFEKATKTHFNSISEDGMFGLYYTSDIGMGDQEPAAIINNVVFPKITTYRVREIIAEFINGKSVTDLINSYGEGHNQDNLIHSMTTNNLLRRGRVIFSSHKEGLALEKVVQMTPDEVIEEVKESNLRGRGGAGFPTGLKWMYCRKVDSNEKYVMCNADEGEPGTFKDRVILTEVPQLLFEGMAIAGYAIGASQGILYLRYEYKYLVKYLESELHKARKKGILGKNIKGKKDFNFDIRIQLGAGAYVCGEETALIESCEGKRGEPRNRPPFPIERGFLNKPTIINNVESLCTIPKIIEKGAKWYSSMGTQQSAGTKVLSISGDVLYPGVFEVEWGMTIKEVLEMAGGYDAKAVLVGGPSGKLIGKHQFSWNLGYENMSTGGAIIVFNKTRDILDIVENFMEFFIDESCGSCAPCRYLTVILKNKLKKIKDGFGVDSDLQELEHWANQMKKANRCGLGQSAANPILSSLENFREEYEKLINKDKKFSTGFDLDKAIQAGAKAVSRFPVA